MQVVEEATCRRPSTYAMVDRTGRREGVVTLADHVPLVHAAATMVQAAGVLAVDPTPTHGPSPVLNTNGMIDALTKCVVPILLAALGVIFISRAGKGEMSKVLTSSAIAIIGLAFIAGAGLLFLFGKKLVDLILGTSS